jgi:hypothetical protein
MHLPQQATNQPDALDVLDAKSSTTRPCRDYIGVECVKSVGCNWGLFPWGYFPFHAEPHIYSTRKIFWNFHKGSPLKVRVSPDAPVEPDDAPRSARQRFGVRFWKLVTILRLTDSLLGIATRQARHRFGLHHPALPHQKNSLHFFDLLLSFGVDHPTHKRALYRSSAHEPAIFYRNQKVIIFRASDSEKWMGDNHLGELTWRYLRSASR